MSWMKTAAATCLTFGIALAGAVPSSAAGVRDATASAAAADATDNLPATTEENFRLLSPEEQRQSTRADLRLVFPGITDAEADAYAQDKRTMSVLAYQLLSDYPQFFAYHEVADNKKYTATLHLKGAPSSVLELIKRAGPPGLMIDNAAKYNRAERTSITGLAHDPIAASGLASSVWSHYDYRTDSITVEVTPKASVSLETILAGAQASVSLPKVGLSTSAQETTKVVYERGKDTEVDAVMSGGTALSLNTRTQANPNPDLQCTAGFGARDTQSTRYGLLGAEHCGKRLAYEGSWSLSIKQQANGSVLADGQFLYNDSHSSRNAFIWASGGNNTWLVRNVTANGLVGVGDRVCQFGHTSAYRHVNAYKCANVVALDGKWSSSLYNYTNQAKTNSDITDGGDSGGPWYYDNTAFGVHSASTTGYVGSSGSSQFSQIFDIHRKTGAITLTS